MTNILKEKRFSCRVSSVLNRDSRQFGKQHIFDGFVDTCWNSDQGSPQWILIEFDEASTVEAFSLQFQGGFVGKDCKIEGGADRANMRVIEAFYPEDNNSLQTFNLSKPECAKYLCFNFSSSTDFFGRIVVYHLEIYSSKPL